MCDCAYLSVNSMLIKTLQANLTFEECSKKLITIMPVFIRLIINNNKKKTISKPIMLLRNLKVLASQYAEDTLLTLEDDSVFLERCLRIFDKTW